MRLSRSPVALTDCLIDRRVAVGVVGECAVERLERRTAVLLLAAGREQRVVASVAQIIESDQRYNEFRPYLEQHGVGIVLKLGKRGHQPQYNPNDPEDWCLFIAYELACKELLRDTRWRHSSIGQILRETDCLECDGRGLAFRNAQLPCGFCRGLGLRLTPLADPTKVLK